MTEEQAVEGIEWATNEIIALRAKIASFEAAQSASNSPTTNVEVSEPPLKSEGLYYAGGGHAPASGSRDGSEILAPAMEAARIPAAPNDVERVLRAFADKHSACGDAWNLSSVLACVRSAIPIPATAKEEERAVFQLTKHEIQSGSDRVNWAEGLILQLPEDHDGRNSWLLNHGRKEEAVQRREKRGIKWNERTQSAETINSTTGQSDIEAAIPIPATGDVDHSKLIGDLRTVFDVSSGWSTIRTATLERAISALLIPAMGEVEAWRQCALYDATMEGPVFKGWDRSAMDRCRRRYIDAALTDHTTKGDE